MLQCWRDSPKTRCTFRQIVEDLEDLVGSSSSSTQAAELLPGGSGDSLQPSQPASAAGPGHDAGGYLTPMAESSHDAGNRATDGPYEVSEIAGLSGYLNPKQAVTIGKGTRGTGSETRVDDSMQITHS